MAGNLSLEATSNTFTVPATRLESAGVECSSLREYVPRGVLAIPLFIYYSQTSTPSQTRPNPFLPLPNPSRTGIILLILNLGKSTNNINLDTNIILQPLKRKRATISIST
jgi:hypothetical protein